MCNEIHVHIALDGHAYPAASYAFQVLLATSDARAVLHATRPTRLSPDAILITYSRTFIEPDHQRHLVIYAADRLWDHYGTTASLPSSPLARIPLQALGARPSRCLDDPLVLPYVSSVAPAAIDIRPIGPSGSGVSIVTGADLVASSFFWITLYEETLLQERDEIGRIPQDRLRSVQEEITVRPLVDEYSVLLLTWLRMLGYRPSGKATPLRVLATHDVDSGIGVKGLRAHLNHGLRTAFREIVRQRRPTSAMVALQQWARRAIGLSSEASLFRDIVTLDAEYGLRSFFFLMANGTHPYDATYDILSDPASRVIRTIRDAGGQIGLHVGLNAHTSPEQFQNEWQYLQRAAPQATPIARSHYLALFPPHTWRQLVEFGFKADSTVGFSRHLGFRSGTCHAYRPFDLERQVVLPIWELPMAIMDINLFLGFPRTADDDRISSALDLAARIRAHGGCLVLNWHNVYCFGHYLTVYRAILAAVRDAQGVDLDHLPAGGASVIW